ncbi:unnamed protein product, partial [Cylicocyclus nassatus]
NIASICNLLYLRLLKAFQKSQINFLKTAKVRRGNCHELSRWKRKKFCINFRSRCLFISARRDLKRRGSTNLILLTISRNLLSTQYVN